MKKKIVTRCFKTCNPLPPHFLFFNVFFLLRKREMKEMLNLAGFIISLNFTISRTMNVIVSIYSTYYFAWQHFKFSQFCFCKHFSLLENLGIFINFNSFESFHSQETELLKVFTIHMRISSLFSL